MNEWDWYERVVSFKTWMGTHDLNWIRRSFCRDNLPGFCRCVYIWDATPLFVIHSLAFVVKWVRSFCTSIATSEWWFASFDLNQTRWRLQQCRVTTLQFILPACCNRWSVQSSQWSVGYTARWRADFRSIHRQAEEFIEGLPSLGTFYTPLTSKFQQIHHT